MHTADTSETTITRRRRRRIAAIALATAVALGGLTVTDTSSDSGDEIAWFGSTWS